MIKSFQDVWKIIHLSVPAMSTKCWTLCTYGKSTKCYKFLIYIWMNSPFSGVLG